MVKANTKQLKRDRRRKKIRVKISGSAKRPRLSVFRSNRGLFLQLINDQAGKTLLSVGGGKRQGGKKTVKQTKIEAGFALGKELARQAVAAGIKKVVFDRGGYKFHGRVKAVADGAREGGLEL